MRDSVNIRVARDEDGAAIKALLLPDAPELEDVSFDRVFPNWLVAENRSGICGCLQVCGGLPMGWIEWLGTDPNLSHVERASVVKALLLSGLAALRSMGSQIACGSVPFHMKSYKRMLKNRGAAVVMSGNTFAKRL